MEISKSLVDEEFLIIVCLENGVEDIEVIDELFIIIILVEDFLICKSVIESNLNIIEFM